MTRLLRFLLLSLAALEPVHAQVTDVPIAERESLPGLEVFVDGLVDAVMAEHTALPGITISVVKDGKIILLKGYGLANVENNIPVDPANSMFRIGSITKTFTGLAVMQLVDEGMLNLDADVNTYLDNFTIPDTFDEPITLRALISHRAGFEDSAFGHLFVQDARKVRPLDEYLANFMPERVSPPGITSTYTNYGIALAGYIVEVVSGQEFASYVEQHVFERLNMDHSTMREPLGADHPDAISAELEPLLVTGYAKGPDGKPAAQPFDFVGQVGPAGSISSTAKDMANYMIARLDDDRYEGGRLVSPDTTARMRERLYDDRPLALDAAHSMADGTFDGYEWRWHNGGTTTFFSDMTLYPELRLGLFISTNSRDGGPEASAMIPKLIFERYFPSRAVFVEPKPADDFVVRGQKYAGHYMLTRRSHTKLQKLLALTASATFSVDTEGYLIRSFGGQQTRYVEIEPGVFQSAEAEPADRNRTDYIYFYENENGVPVRASVLVNDLTRVSYWQSPDFFFLTIGVAVFFSLTTLLGAWRRVGRSSKEDVRQRWAAGLSTTTAIAVLVAAGGLGFTTAMAASNDTSIFFDWPPSSLKAVLYAAILIIFLAVGMTVLLRAAWSTRGWSLWRQIHYTLFTLSCVTLLWAFVEWNLIGFKYF